MPKLITQLKRRLEVNRDIDTDVNAYVNKDTRPLPPSRRTYGPWSFVGLWMVCSSTSINSIFTIRLIPNFQGHGKFQCRRLDHRIFSHITRPQRMAVDARHRHCSHFCRLRMHSWRSPRSEMAHRIPILDETSLGYLGLSVSYGHSSVPILRLDIDKYLVWRSMSKGLPNLSLAVIRQPQ